MSCENQQCNCHEMTEEEFQAKLLAARQAMITDVPTLWWLSICDPDKEEGSQFHGLVIMDCAPGEEPIGKLETSLGIKNDDFEVMVMKVPDEYFSEFPAEYRNRLLGEEEAALFGDKGDGGEQPAIEAHELNLGETPPVH